MSLIKWNDEQYSIGIESIDEQHKRLFDMVNSLHDSFANGEREKGVQEVIRSLAEYVGYHFAAEEKLMAKHNYEGFKYHQKLHNDFKKKIAGMIKKYRSDPAQMYSELLSSLRNWITDHILEHDRKMAIAINGVTKETVTK